MSDEEIPTLVNLEIDDAVEKVPVTIVTGFLGSGKTTLINYVLNASHGKKIAVILNDFAEGSAAESLASLNENGGSLFEEWVELRNGCLCCSLKDPGVKAIENLLKKRGKFDYILLETTGLADPGPIAALFWMDENLCSQITLDGVVTLLDAKYCLKTLSTHDSAETVNACERQIGLADVLILNKMDLVEKEEASLLQKTVCGINASAKIIETSYSEIDLSQILDLNLYSSRLDKMTLVTNAIPFSTIFDNELHNSFISARPHLDHSITTVTIEEMDIRLYKKKFEDFIENLLWEESYCNKQNKTMTAMRVKGVIHFFGEETPSSIQCVNQLYNICSMSQASAGQIGTVGVRLVFIGRNLDRDILLNHLRECK